MTRDDTARLHVTLSAEEVERLEDWRHEFRAPTRSEAIRHLIDLGDYASDQVMISPALSAIYDLICDKKLPADVIKTLKTAAKELADGVNIARANLKWPRHTVVDAILQDLAGTADDKTRRKARDLFQRFEPEVPGKRFGKRMPPAD